MFYQLEFQNTSGQKIEFGNFHSGINSDGDFEFTDNELEACTSERVLPEGDYYVTMTKFSNGGQEAASYDLTPAGTIHLPWLKKEVPSTFAFSSDADGIHISCQNADNACEAYLNTIMNSLDQKATAHGQDNIMQMTDTAYISLHNENEASRVIPNNGPVAFNPFSLAKDSSTSVLTITPDSAGKLGIPNQIHYEGGEVYVPGYAFKRIENITITSDIKSTNSEETNAEQDGYSIVIRRKNLEYLKAINDITLQNNYGGGGTNIDPNNPNNDPENMLLNEQIDSQGYYSLKIGLAYLYMCYAMVGNESANLVLKADGYSDFSIPMALNQDIYRDPNITVSVVGEGIRIRSDDSSYLNYLVNGDEDKLGQYWGNGFAYIRQDQGQGLAGDFFATNNQSNILFITKHNHC